MQEKVTRHFGVYGICREENRVLCIEKNAGPYKNRYDLPGGSQILGEGLTETLQREFLEETGYCVTNYSNSRIYDVFVKESGSEVTVHHMMVFYDVRMDESQRQKELPTVLDDGENDSNGAVWIELTSLTAENSSPLILKMKEECLGETVLDKQIYNEWIVK